MNPTMNILTGTLPEDIAEMSRSVTAVPPGVRILVVDDDQRVCQHTATTLATRTPA